MRRPPDPASVAGMVDKGTGLPAEAFYREGTWQAIRYGLVRAWCPRCAGLGTVPSPRRGWRRLLIFAPARRLPCDACDGEGTYECDQTYQPQFVRTGERATP